MVCLWILIRLIFYSFTVELRVYATDEAMLWLKSPKPSWHYSLLQHYLCGILKCRVNSFLGWLLWALFWSSREGSPWGHKESDTAERLSLTFREGCGLVSPMWRLYIDKIENAHAKYSTMGKYIQISVDEIHIGKISFKKIWYPTFSFPSTSFQNGIHSYNFKAKSLYNSLLKVHLNSFWTIFFTTCCQCN